MSSRPAPHDAALGAPTNVYGAGAPPQAPNLVTLLKSIPRIEYPSHTRLLAITGRPPDLVSPPPGCNFAPRCPYAQERCHVEEPPQRHWMSPSA